MAKAQPQVKEDVAELPFADDEKPDNEAPQYEAKEVVLGAEPSSKSEKQILPADDGAAELKRQLEAQSRQLENEARARQQAEAAARAEHERATMAERQTAAVSTYAIDQAIEAANRQSEQASGDLERAWTTGDYKAAAGIQRQIARNEANLLALQQQKQMVETQAAAPRQATPQVQIQQAPPSFDAETLAATLERSGSRKSAEWIRAHPEAVADQRGRNRVEAAHAHAVNIVGLVPETAEYFAQVEQTLGMGEPVRRAEPVPTPMQQRQTVQRGGRPAAPVSPSTPNLSGRTQRQSITLSPEQRAHAHDVLGMTDEEYAGELMAAQESGKLYGGRH